MLAMLALMSCSLEDDLLPENGRDGYVEFIVRPTSFSAYNVSALPTKATYTEEQLTDIEKKVVNAYFLIFKPNGQLYEVKDLTSGISGNIIPSHSIRTDVNKGDITACFLANVPAEYVAAIDDVTDLTTPIPLEYASYEDTGYIGIPTLNGTPCFPMCGIYNGPLAGTNNQITVQVERLFAKVKVTLSMDMGTDLLGDALGGAVDDIFGDLFGGLTLGNTAENARFELSNYALNNLPTQVRPAKYATVEEEDSTLQPTEESTWVKDADSFEGFPSMMPDVNVIYDKSHPNANQPNYPTAFTFFFYTPEYALLPESDKVATYEDKDNPERYKPALYDKTKYPISMSLEGRLHDHGGTYADVKYNVYFGESSFDNFSLFRNRQYNNALTIKGAGHLSKGETIDNRVEVLPLNLVEAYGQAANCYIISIPGTYELDTYKGVIKNITASSPKVSGSPVTVWNQSANTITFDAEESKDGLIVFTVDNATGNIQPGNAVIAAQTSSGIQWSWHLWFCEPDSRPDNTDYQHNYPTSGAKVMNRSLGATINDESGIASTLKKAGYDVSVWEDGLYYQWGRKDPIRLNTGETAVYDDADDSYDGTLSGATYANSVKNPKAFYTDWGGTYTSENADATGWSADKSLNDPCPPGYKVPPTSIWTLEKGSQGLENLLTYAGDIYPYNAAMSLDLAGNVIYPYSGRIQPADGVLTKEDIGVIVYESPAGQVFDLGLKIDILNINIIGAKVKNLVLEIESSTNMGEFWANNGSGFQFEHASINLSLSNITSIADKITIRSCEIMRNNYEITYRWGIIPTGVKDNWESSYSKGTGADLTTANKLFLLEELFTNSTALSDLPRSFDTSISPASGCHVRCVKE
jgi:hypothetical protein